jgi:hypothetical protein
MRSQIKLHTLRVAALLAAPIAAFPAAVTLTVGSTVNCEYGPCSSVDTLSAGQTTSGNVAVTFNVNGDQYSLSSPFSAADHDPNGTSISFSPTVTYLGTSPTAQADKFTIDFLQNYSYSGPLNGYYYDESTLGTLNGKAAPSSNFTAQLFYNGQGLGLMGPFYVGTSSGDGEKQLYGLSSPLTADYQFVYDFAAGTLPGAGASAPNAPSATPEPSAYALTLLGGIAALMSSRRRRRTA